MDIIETETIIIGGGLIGLAIAYEFSNKTKNFILIEQHASFCVETSSRNSEVIHAGIYYKENSLKAKLCVEGKKLLYNFCQLYNIPYKKCGKYIVSLNESQNNFLIDIQKKASHNNVDLNFLNSRELKKINKLDHFHSALYSSETGIVDSHQFAKTLIHLIKDNPHCEIVFNTKFVSLIEENSDYFKLICIDSNGEQFIVKCKNVVNCAGLFSGKVAENFLTNQKYSIKPCRGHYYNISGKYKNYFDQLIYPIPDPTGGLGLHITLDLDGYLKIGPDVDWSVANEEVFNNNTLLQFNKKNIDLKRKFYLAAKNLIPTIEENEIHEAYIGLRPKLFINDILYEDFLIKKSSKKSTKSIHLLGIESPGLTSSLSIAKLVLKSMDV